MIPDDIWEEQAAFNALLRDLPTTWDGRSAITKEFLLHLFSETDELLRCIAWKPHRKIDVPENRAQMATELIDIFKYWMSIAQALGFSQTELQHAFWRKSMAVRQRYAQEFITQINRPAVIVDIDNVLADYLGGLVPFIKKRFPKTQVPDPPGWLNATTLKIEETDWTYIKWAFRTSGEKRRLPLIAGAKEFLDRIRSAGLMIVLLTSRPIDQFPTLFEDTVEWLHVNALPYDILWWAANKPLRIPEEVRQHIRFAVDDDIKFVEQFAGHDIKTYWLGGHGYNPNTKFRGVRTLLDILTMEGL